MICSGDRAFDDAAACSDRGSNAANIAVHDPRSGNRASRRRPAAAAHPKNHKVHVTEYPETRTIRRRYSGMRHAGGLMILGGWNVGGGR